jgi:hypothetical protein
LTCAFHQLLDDVVVVAAGDCVVGEALCHPTALAVARFLLEP